MVTILGRSLLICFNFFFPKNATYFLGNNHNRLKGFFNRFCDSLQERVVGKEAFRFDCWSLKHRFPNLVWIHKKPNTNCFDWNVWYFQLHVTMLPFYILLHTSHEFINVRLVKSKLSIPFVLMQIGDGMMVQPYLQEDHKHLSAWSIRLEQHIGLVFPFHT